MKEFDAKYSVRTDLAAEARAYAHEKNKGRGNDGIIADKKIIDGITVETLEITDSAQSELCSKPCGKYITVNIGEIWNSDKESFDKIAHVISAVLRSLFPQDGSCLLCAMGNSAITADALGPVVASNFIVTRHIKTADKALFDSFELRETMCIIPGVTAKTGYEGAQSVKGIVNALNPDFAVVVDALASRKLSRLGTTVQICDSGLAPGSGVGNERAALNRETLGIPVFAIGVPTVVEAQTLALDILSDALEKSDKGSELESALELLQENPTAFFVTPKDTDHIIKDVSKLLGYSLNLALHKDLTIGEIDEFLS